MVNLGEAYRKLIGKTVRATRTDKQMTVRATRADKQMTKEGQTNDEEMMKDNGGKLKD